MILLIRYDTLFEANLTNGAVFKAASLGHSDTPPGREIPKKNGEKLCISTEILLNFVDVAFIIPYLECFVKSLYLGVCESNPLSVRGYMPE